MTKRCVFALLLVLALTPLAFSKGSPELIVISGGGLAQPVEITDQSLLKAFDPWTGQFADWQEKPLADAPCFRRSFKVQFYMRWPGRESSLDRDNLQMIYATRYCSTGTSGYIYLPGPGESDYRSNVVTIIRGHADGTWHPSTGAWNSLMGDAVATSDPQREAEMILISGGELKHPVEITDSEALREFDPWNAGFVDWDHPVSGGSLGWEYEIQYFKRGVEQTTPYDRDGLTMIYSVRYCVDKNGGPGSVYLAGPGDKFGPENVRMVWDGTYAGRWSRSTAAWHALIEREVSAQHSAEHSPERGTE
jgi:hypothetical protein